MMLNRMKAAAVAGALVLFGFAGVNSYAASASGLAVTGGASISTGSLIFTWNIGAAAAPLEVLSTDFFTTIVSSASDAAGTGTTTYPNIIVAGLNPNTTYWFEVKSTTDTDPLGYVSSAASTLAAPPTSFFNQGDASLSTFTAVNSAFIGVQFSSGAGIFTPWSNPTISYGYNRVGSTYTIVLATVSIPPGGAITFPGTLTSGGAVSLSTMTTGTTATIPAAAVPLAGNILPNTPYYFYAKAINNNGLSTVYTGPYGSTSTLGNHPASAPALSTFSSVGSNGLTASFMSNGNPLNITTYTVVLSTVNGKQAQVLGASGNFVNLTTMAPTGTSGSYTSTLISTTVPAGALIPNTSYFLYANAVNFNNVGSTYAALGGTATLAAAPATFSGLPASISTFSVVSSSIMSVSWASGTVATGYNPIGVTSYTVVFSTWGFLNTSASGNVSLSTMPAGEIPSASVPGLKGNTTYWAFINAANIQSNQTTYTTFPSTVTQAIIPLFTNTSVAGSTTAAINWLANGNSTNTLYVVQISTDPNFGALNIAGQAFVVNTSTFFTGLGSGRTYYSRARAISWNGGTTANAPLGALTTSGGPFSAPTASAFTGVAIASITANWTYGGTAGETSFRVVVSTDPGFATLTTSSISLNTFAKFGAGGEGGVTTFAPNTRYYFAVQSTATGGASIFASLGSTFTLAVNPTASQLVYTGGVGQVFATSATITWTTGLNEFLVAHPPLTNAEIRRSSTSDFNASVTTIAPANVSGAQAYTDNSLLGCSTYFFRVANSNGNGVPSSFAPGTLAAPFLTIVTSNTTPAAPTGLTINPQTGSQLLVSWSASATEGITQYNLYWDSGTGVSLSTGLTSGTNLAPHLFSVFGSSITSFTTPVLNSTNTYTFKLTAKHRCGVEEPVGALAFAGSTGTLAEVRASLASPLAGSLINGGAAAQGGSNAIAVSANLVFGSPAAVSQVEFQYQPAGGTTWSTIGYSSATPYAVLWNPSPNVQPAPDMNTTLTNRNGLNLSNNNGITACPGAVSPLVFNAANGCLYNLRAVAYDLNGSSDAFAGSAQVTLIPTQNVDPNNVLDNPLIPLGFHYSAIGANLTLGIANTAAVIELTKLSDAVAAKLTVSGGGVVMNIAIDAGAFGNGEGVWTLSANALAPTSAPLLPSGYSPIFAQAANAPTAPISFKFTPAMRSNPACTPAFCALLNGAQATFRVSYADRGGDNGATGVIAGTTPPLRADQATFLSASEATGPLGPYVKDSDVSMLAPDTVNHFIVGRSNHGTFYLVAGIPAADLSAVRVYPVPWRPSGPDPNEGRPVAAGSLPGPNQGIIFDNLPANFTMKIYTVSGQLVTQKTVSGNLGTGQLIWDGRNDASRDVGSGGYFAVISSPGLKSIVKSLAIIR